MQVFSAGKWRLVSRSDCRELAAIVTKFPFHGRKSHELAVWARAVTAWSGHGPERRAALRRMKSELESLRRYSVARHVVGFEATAKQALWGYISGFLLAEAHLRLTESEAKAVVQVRADDSALLEMLATETGMGAVRIYRSRPPLNPVARWTVASRSNLSLLGSWLLEIGLPGHKGELVRIWADAVGKLDRASDRRRAARRLAVARPYVAAVERELLSLPKPDVTEACRTALKRWAADEQGALSSVGYARWRAQHPGHPTRNTIASRYGSWRDALEAAQLCDRLARGPRRVGGEPARAARREQQRARVIAAVRRFEREHGHVPRALEFFRWRYKSAIDAPSQGSVYKLFPGGWAEVLERTRQVAGATV